MRLSDLLGRPVVTESGRRLGHVFDVRVSRRAGSTRRRADQQWSIDGLLIGRRGLLDRLGVQASSRKRALHTRGVIAWDAVLELSESEIRVLDGADSD